MRLLQTLVRSLIKLFSKGGKIKGGKFIPPNPTAIKNLQKLERLQQTNPEVWNKLSKLPKQEQIEILKKTKQGKLSISQLIDKVKSAGRKIKARAVTPIGYNLSKPFGIPLEILLPKIGPKYQSLRNRYDAWYLYNNAPQKYNSLIKIGTHTDGLPAYSIKNFTIAKNEIDAIIRNPKQKDILTTFNFGGVHGNGGAYKGIDKKGNFIVFYDHWDLQPLKGVVNRLGKKLKLPKTQTDKIANWEVGGKPFWTKNKIYYDDAGNVFRADGKTPLYQTKGTMYKDITTAPDQAMLNVKNVNKRKSALQRLGKKEVTVYSTEPITPETLSAMLGEWGTHLKYSKIKSTAMIATGTFAGLGALASYIISKDDDQRRKVGEYMIKNKLSQKDLNDKLQDKQFASKLDKQIGK